MSAGQLREGSKADALVRLLQARETPATVDELLRESGEPSTRKANRRIRTRLFELCDAGHVVKVLGNPVRFEAQNRGDVGPALAMPLPAIPAALPSDRSLRPHVGVVVLLDRRAA